MVCPDNHGDLKYDTAYQRLRNRNAMLDTNEVSENSEKCIQEGNRIIDVGNLVSFLAHKTVCRPCATRAAVQLAFDFASVLDKDAGVATRQRRGPSYSNQLQHYLQRSDGYEAALNIPSFSPAGESKQGFASTIHIECLGIERSCDLDGRQLQETSTSDGVSRYKSRFVPIKHH